MGLTETTQVTLSAEVAKTTTCEKCGATYRYKMRRSAAGQSVGLIFFSSEKKATARAEKNLARELATGIDTVACPACGWYQRDMVQRVKKMWLMGTLGSAVAIACICHLVPGAKPELESGWWSIGFVVAGMLAVLGFAVFFAYDPNRMQFRLFKRRTGQLVSAGRSEAAGAVAEPVPPPLPASRTPAKVTIECPKCRKAYSVPPQVIGRKGKCKQCGNVFEAVEKDVDLSDLE